MSADFLTTLAARTLGLASVMEPAIASRFTPISSFLLGNGEWGVEDLSQPSNCVSATIRDARGAAIQSGNATEFIANPQSPIAITQSPQANPLHSIPTTKTIQRQVDAATPSSPLDQMQSDVSRATRKPELDATSAQPVPTTVKPQINPVNLQQNTEHQQLFTPLAQEIATSVEQSSAIPELVLPNTPATIIQPLNLEQSNTLSQLPVETAKVVTHDTQKFTSNVNLSNVNLQQTINNQIPFDEQSQEFSTNREPETVRALELQRHDINVQQAIYNQLPLGTQAQELSNIEEHQLVSQSTPSEITPTIIQPEVDNVVTASPKPSQFANPQPSKTLPQLPVEDFQAVVPLVEPLINHVNLQQATVNQQSFDEQTQEISTVQERQLIEQSMTSQTIPKVIQSQVDNVGKQSQTISESNNSQANKALPRLPVEHFQAVAPLVESSIYNVNLQKQVENQQLSTSQRREIDNQTEQSNPIQQYTVANKASPQPTISNAGKLLPVVSKLINKIPERQYLTNVPPNVPPIIQTKANPTAQSASVLSITTNTNTQNKHPQVTVSAKIESLVKQVLLGSGSANQFVSSMTSLSQPRMSRQSPEVVSTITVTPEHQSVAESSTVLQAEENLMVDNKVSPQIRVAPLVSKYIPRSGESSEVVDAQTRLPSTKNSSKVKPLIVISQQLSNSSIADNTGNLREFARKNGRGISGASSVSKPTIQVTIGRIEVRSSQPPTAPASNTKTNRRNPSVSLQDYLKQRDGGKL